MGKSGAFSLAYTNTRVGNSGHIYLSLLFYNLKDIFWMRSIRGKLEDSRDAEYLYYLSLSFLASFAGFFASGTFLSVLYYPHYWYLTGILVASRKIANNILTQ